MFSKQSLLNQMAKDISTESFTLERIEILLKLIKTLDGTDGDDIRVCGFKGVDFNKAIITDKSEFFDSVDLHLDLVQSYVYDETCKILLNETKLNNDKNLNASNQMAVQKTNLAMMLNEIGCTTLDRKATFLFNTSFAAKRVLDEMDSTGYLNAFIDSRMKKNSPFLELWYPHRLHESVITLIQASGERDWGLTKNDKLEVISHLVPGHKDVVDLKEILEVRNKHNNDCLPPALG